MPRSTCNKLYFLINYLMISVILAGGENTRFPSLKALIKVRGESIIERNLRVLQRITGRAVISTNAPELYFRLGVPVIGDVIKSSGPMAGLFSTFLSAGAEELFATACDMPFIKERLIRYIIDNRGGQATVPVFGDRPEPLLAVYSRSAMRTMEAMLVQGERSLTGLIERLEVNYLDESAIRKIDPHGESFMNINTLEDYDRAIGKRALI